MNDKFERDALYEAAGDLADAAGLVLQSDDLHLLADDIGEVYQEGERTVSQACDELERRIGGSENLEAYLRTLRTKS